MSNMPVGSTTRSSAFLAIPSRGASETANSSRVTVARDTTETDTNVTGVKRKFTKPPVPKSAPETSHWLDKANRLEFLQTTLFRIAAARRSTNDSISTISQYKGRPITIAKLKELCESFNLNVGNIEKIAHSILNFRNKLEELKITPNQIDSSLLQRCSSTLPTVLDTARKVSAHFSCLLTNTLGIETFYLREETSKFCLFLLHRCKVLDHKLLSQGSYGKVFYYLLCDLNGTISFPFTIKQAHGSDLDNDLLKREFTILTSIPPHPNIIDPFLFTESCERNNMYMDALKMDFVTFVNEGHSSIELFQVLDHVLDGLIHLHSNNILHADLKPENILLGNTPDNVKICDFGNAIQVNKETPSFGTTLQYVAPEYLNRAKRKVSTASDIWSFGALIYVCFTGRFIPNELTGIKSTSNIQEIILHFGAFNDQAKVDELIEALGSEKTPIPKSVLKGISKETLCLLKDFLHKTLRLDPLDRITAIEAKKHPLFSRLKVLQSAADAKQEELAVNVSSSQDEKK